MQFPARFSALPEYAFPRLRALLADLSPGATPIDMSIGEPRHPIPSFVTPILAQAISGFGRYPPNEGSHALLAAIQGWIARRYGVALGPERLMVLNGSREGLFNATLALVPEEKRGRKPAVLIPNPFYQAYAVGVLAVGAEPVYVPATDATGYLPDFKALPETILNRTAAAFICTPSNPQGAVASADYLADLAALAEHYDFQIFSDECYSELWRTAPPPGMLSVAAARGADPERVVLFQSLSKRSNLPGLRSGFVAGGAETIARLRRLRAYAGAPVPGPLQEVSAALWSDEQHVLANRALYARKYALADSILGALPGYRSPEAGFFLWLRVPQGDGEAAARLLWAKAGLRVLPGEYLGRAVEGVNPGAGHIRVALVAAEEETRAGLTRLAQHLSG